MASGPWTIPGPSTLTASEAELDNPEAMVKYAARIPHSVDKSKVKLSDYRAFQALNGSCALQARYTVASTSDALDERDKVTNANPSRIYRFRHHFLLLRCGSRCWLLSQRQDEDLVRFPAFQA